MSSSQTANEIIIVNYYSEVLVKGKLEPSYW